MRSLLGRSSTPPPLEPLTSATHKRSDLVLELDNAAGLKARDTIYLSVDVSRIHIFDQHGRRVDRVKR
jgi:multiple sugar transport system ATP-binding protein